MADPSAQNTLSSGPYHQPNDSRSVAVCWQCKQPGHIRRHCPENEVKAHEVSGQAQTTPATRGSGQKSRLNPLDQDDVYLKLYLKGKELPCLLDSGCEITMIPKSTIDEIGGFRLLPFNQRICAANNTEIEIIGRVIAPFRLGRHVFEANALLSPDIVKVMLGSNWLRRH